MKNEDYYYYYQLQNEDEYTKKPWRKVKVMPQGEDEEYEGIC